MLRNDNSIISDYAEDVNTVNKIFRKHRPKVAEKYNEIADLYDDDDYRYRANRVSDCGSFLEFSKFLRAGLKLTRANFCSDRLCSMCNWRRSLRTFAKFAKIVDSKAFKETKYRTIFLTLTLQNCDPYELGDALKHLSYSFDKFLKNKRIKKMNRGYFRALEITYNKDKQEFHHHLHVIFAVNSTYFTDSNLYLKQSDFTTLWEKSADLYYKPQVFIKKVRDKGGIAEISKYCVKVDDDLLKNIPIEYLKILRDELSNRRLVGLGGIFRKISSDLKLNLNDDDIVSDDIDNLKNDTLLAILRLSWNVGIGKYELVEKEEVGF